MKGTGNSRHFCRIWAGDMYRYYFMAKNNIRKQKGDMITFFFSILILLIIGVLEGAGLIVLLVFLTIGAIRSIH